MGYYDIAQICLNGHTITRNAQSSPEFRRKFCPKCGEPTITNCPSCNTPILGEYHVEGVVFLGGKTPPPPNFCHACGAPYPWTERRIEAAKALADEFENLSSAEKEKLKRSLDDLYRDTANTEVATFRFKKLMAKVGQESYAAMKEILISIVSETVRKSLFGA